MGQSPSWGLCNKLLHQVLQIQVTLLSIKHCLLVKLLPPKTQPFSVAAFCRKVLTSSGPAIFQGGLSTTTRVIEKPPK